jgi:DAACS family dicarboxylate/amino acid:cation (Na+ or H+) symporter
VAHRCAPPDNHRAMARHTKILLGLLVGAVLGILCNKLAGDAAWVGHVQKYLSDPLGKIFFNMLVMVVIPLVFTSLALGVAQIGDVKQLGRMGLRTMSYFLLVTAAAVAVGLLLVNTLRPGDRLAPETKARLLATFGQEAAQLKSKADQTELGVSTLVDIVPRNPAASIAKPTPEMLSLIFVALIVGVALTLADKQRTATLVRLLEGIYDVTLVMINIAMGLAPYGVAALIFSTTSRFGIELLVALGMYVVTVLGGLALHLLGTLALLVWLLARYNPWRFFRKIQTVMLTAFSTSSSAATLPTTMAVAEQELGIPAKISGFVLPLGATMNMNGTALFEGVTVVFVAQVFGVQLGLVAQVIVVLMSVLTAVGAAGVPSGSIPLLIIVLQMVHVPPEGIAIVLGVDRILDMCRTVLNVVGDVICAAYVARTDGVELKQ